MPETVPSDRPASDPHADASLRLDNQLCFSVHAAALAITKAYRPLLEPLGLTYPQYLVLLVLWEQDGLTVSQIGARLCLDSGTLTPLLKRLEAGGLIRRQRGLQDERQVTASLTEAGQALKAEATRVPLAMGAAMAGDGADLGRLRGDLDQLRLRLTGAA